jgi:heterodisulfide reductase subunit C/nitrate reductase gamma subunit
MQETLLGSKFLFVCLYVSLCICGCGVVFRAARWFFVETGPRAGAAPVYRRLWASIRGFAVSLFSPKFFLFFKLLIFDVILQTRIIRTDFTRWIMHIFIFTGFMLLLLMHALDNLVTKNIFAEYYSTIDPYQYLRNVFGVMVVAGVGVAIFRRIRYRGPMLTTRYADRYAIALLAVIIITGFFVESAKISSESVFNRMLKDFSAASEPGDDDAVRAFWAKEYGTVFSSMKGTISEKMVARGKELNAQSCASCHSPTKTAFISYGIARGMRSAAVPLDAKNANMILYYIHVLACFLGLAYLPFSKMFHLITDPLSIIINGMSDVRNVNSASAMPRRALELDACTACGTCSRKCSVEPVYRMMRNREALPMDKLRTVRRLSSGKAIDAGDMRLISEGAFVCTSCLKCTEVCPAGINLQDQWFSSRDLLSEKGFPMPHVWIKKFSASEWSDIACARQKPGTETDATRGRYYNLTADSEIFAHCIQCQTCTNVCPVVAARTAQEDAVDITPQKIMNLLRLGLNDLAMGSRMVWDCTTCYQCQENCPQGIKVTDIIYELKNKAYRQYRDIDREEKRRADTDQE